MKKLSFLAVAGLLVTSLANAIEVPGWERPIMGAALNYIVPTKPVEGLRAQYLTLNQQDGAEQPTSFTLTEDTGIRCVVAPCPSTRETEFTIQSIDYSRRADSVRYVAVEVLKNIPPHVRIARRQLIVNESSMELVAPGGDGFMRRTIWQVEVRRFAQPSHNYYGTAEPLASIQ